MGNKVRLTEKDTSILRYLYRAGQRPVIAGDAVAEGLGLQLGTHHAHARDAHLSNRVGSNNSSEQLTLMRTSTNRATWPGRQVGRSGRTEAPERLSDCGRRNS
jgi:hypothetical protein